MNGTTRCSGMRAGGWMCPLRDSCRVHERYLQNAAEAAYELEPPFIGNQCDHYERMKAEDRHE